MRIHRFDQSNFLASPPRLDFLLAVDCCVRMHEFFVIDQSCEVVSAGEAGDEFILMLKNTMRQVAGDACIQGVRARAVGHDVDEEASVYWHDGPFLFHGRMFRRTASSRNAALLPAA